MSACSIEDIKIGHRFRKDLGDIEALARSIFEIGLLHPIAVTPDKKLVAGRRRLEAFKRLNRKEIPVHVVDIDSLARGELVENSMRKSFTTSERVAIGTAVRQEIKDQASKRRLAGQKTGGRGRKKKLCGTLPPSLGEQGKTRDRVAMVSGMKERTFARAEAVVTAAEEDPKTFGPIKDEMDETGNVSAAHRKMQALHARRESVIQGKSESTPKPKPAAVSLLMECKKAWSRGCAKWFEKMSDKDRREFIKWIGE